MNSSREPFCAHRLYVGCRCFLESEAQTAWCISKTCATEMENQQYMPVLNRFVFKIFEGTKMFHKQQCSFCFLLTMFSEEQVQLGMHVGNIFITFFFLESHYKIKPKIRSGLYY